MTALTILESHAKWLRMAADEIRRENHDGWGNTCEQAADAIDAHIHQSSQHESEGAEKHVCTVRCVPGEHACQFCGHVGDGGYGLMGHRCWGTAGYESPVDEALSDARMTLANIADGCFANRHSLLQHRWAADIQRQAEQGRDAIDKAMSVHLRPRLPETGTFGGADLVDEEQECRVDAEQRAKELLSTGLNTLAAARWRWLLPHLFASQGALQIALNSVAIPYASHYHLKGEELESAIDDAIHGLQQEKPADDGRPGACVVCGKAGTCACGEMP